ncbi:DUF397 domain-containing protein [Streptomyces pseudovenezuelae]|uniref:DUF397 domain-containing protein n=1 Tax=Streptomyces pseudovenezuelae TaxID=67350 RepID=UPI0034A0F7BC
MTTPTPIEWKKSSYSGGGEGNDCVEIAVHPTHISIRDSKVVAGTTVTRPGRSLQPLRGGPQNWFRP